MTTKQIKSLRSLSDVDKATLFLYLIEKGLPPWGIMDEQPNVLVAMTGWTLRRATSALDRAVKAGYATKDDPD
jgi:hypothetical protein